MSKSRVLVVGSNADTLVLDGGRTVPIGTYLNELVVPVMGLLAAGYEIVLATPTGAKPVIDPVSVQASHFGNSQHALQEAIDFFALNPVLQHPRTLRSATEDGLDAYAGVFVPGGHAPVVDLMQDPDLGEILRQFHLASRPTALLCHGPIAIVAALPTAKQFRAALKAGDIDNARATSQGWQYAGYKMTIFSNEEEQVVEDQMFRGKMMFYVGDALRIAGGSVVSGAVPFQPNIVEDRELITGQNPRSDHSLAAALVNALDRQAAHFVPA